jgi:hypothetical protein
MDYPNTGALWPNQTRTADNQPSIRGDIKLERGFIKELLNETDEELIVISLAGWTREFKNGKFISLKASKPFVKTNSKPVSENIADDDIPF